MIKSYFDHATNRFAGYQEFILKRTQQPVGRKNEMTEVLELDSNAWKPFKVRKDCFQLMFKDGDSAFLKNRVSQDVHLRERGAYELSKHLGLKVVPETHLVEIPAGKYPFEGSLHNMAGVYSIQDEVKGLSLDKIDRADWARHPIRYNDFVELYLYVFIANDCDHEEQNVFLEEYSNKLRSIDNEYSGKVNSLPVSFPQMLRPFLEEARPLPPKYEMKLERFLQNRENVIKDLLPFYSRKSLDRMFERVEFLLDYPNLGEINRKMRRFRHSRRDVWEGPRTPKQRRRYY